MIDVKKAQQEASGSQAKKDNLAIGNELKIITAPPDVYNIWAEQISVHTQGELIDPSSGEKWKESGKWKEENGVFHKEFFKWLGNISLAQMKRLAEHLSNKPDDKRSHAYPKVIMKSVQACIPDCYSATEWLERRKRKTTVRRQIHNLRPQYMLFTSSGDFIRENWKKFKEVFRITPATLNVLLTAPGEEFFKDGDSWDDSSFKRIKVGIMDFRNIPGAWEAEGSSTAPAWFYNVFHVIKKVKDPVVIEIPVWVWICGDRDAQEKIKHHIKGSEFGANYKLAHSEYLPFSYERLEDMPHTMKKAKDPVQILFLFRKTIRMKIDLPNFFQAPRTPEFTVLGKYNELQYRIHNTELRMEFYLRLLDMFCQKGDAIVSVFGGGKLTCAAWNFQMCSLENFTISPSKEKAKYIELAEVSMNLDRRDFESGYYVDATLHPLKKLEESSKPKEEDKGKGKRKSREFDHHVGEASSRPICIGDDWDDVILSIPEMEALGSQLPITPPGRLG